MECRQRELLTVSFASSAAVRCKYGPYTFLFIHPHSAIKSQCVPINLLVCTLVSALVLQGKTPPAQVAGDDHHECKWSICSLVGGK